VVSKRRGRTIAKVAKSDSYVRVSALRARCTRQLMKNKFVRRIEREQWVYMALRHETV
jgi:hypothetical protein